MSVTSTNKETAAPNGAKRRSDPQNQKYRVKLQELIAEISYLEKELAK